MAAARPRVGRRPGRGAAVEGVLHHGVEAGMTRRSAKLKKTQTLLATVALLVRVNDQTASRTRGGTDQCACDRMAGQ